MVCTNGRHGSVPGGLGVKALDRVLDGLAWFNESAGKVGRNLSLTLVGLMTAAILLQVFFRYVLGSALTWSEEVARFMMVWMTFLVAPIAYRAGANVALDIVISRIPGRAFELLKIIINLLVIGFVVTFFFESFGLIGRGLKMKASTVDIPMAYVYAIIPISFVVMFTVGIELIGRSIQALIDPSRPGSRPISPEFTSVE